MSKMDKADLARLFAQMARIRWLEIELGKLWSQGRIFGELHLGIGEEAAVAGVVDHLVDGDSLALDHRSTPPLLAHGTDPVAIVLETLGTPGGLCRGMGGHMHLFDHERLAASSGIVGACGPLACGFALAATQLRPGAVAVAFFGEGAVNQGMLMESLNLASVWALPVVFVCKDNRLAVTTLSRTVTAGHPASRARAFAMPAVRVNGADVGAVWAAASKAVARARAGRGPTFLHVRCRRPEGHMAGDPLIRAVREPRASRSELSAGLLQAMTGRPGAPPLDRMRAVSTFLAPMVSTTIASRLRTADPLDRARRRLGPLTAAPIETRAREEIAASIAEALTAAEAAAWPA